METPTLYNAEVFVHNDLLGLRLCMTGNIDFPPIITVDQ